MMTLEHAAAAGLPMVDEGELRAELRDQIDAIHGGQTGWARAHGVTPAYVGKAGFLAVP